jgi:hypothetical protein
MCINTFVFLKLKLFKINLGFTYEKTLYYKGMNLIVCTILGLIFQGESSKLQNMFVYTFFESSKNSVLFVACVMAELRKCHANIFLIQNPLQFIVRVHHYFLCAFCVCLGYFIVSVQYRFRLGFVTDAHAQWVMSNGVIIPPREFENPPRWYYRGKSSKV